MMPISWRLLALKSFLPKLAGRKPFSLASLDLSKRLIGKWEEARRGKAAANMKNSSSHWRLVAQEAKRSQQKS
jgi:hypothetical protein